MAQQKQQQKEFDLALCIDDKEQYKLVLIGPLTYFYTPRHLQFSALQKYIKGDINKVNESSNFVQEIDTERYINAFLDGTKDVTDTDTFKNIVKLQLFIFKDEQIWRNYMNEQKNLKSDVVVIVNNENKPIYVLHDAVSSMMNERISCKSFNVYQTKDIAILDKYAAKLKTFTINDNWKIEMDSITNRQTFKNGICYKFQNDECRDKLLAQSYDVALVTDSQNQIQVLLSDITYIYKENAISFKSHHLYKNGFYQKLKQFGQQIRAFKPTKYRLNGEQKAFEFETKFVANKCLLFNISQIDEWIDFIEAQTNIEYDAAVISNNDDYQTIFLNKIQINWMEKVILFAESETFTPKHHGLINKFGKLIKMQPFAEFIVPKLVIDETNKGKLNNIYFYRWDMDQSQSGQTANTQTDATKTKTKTSQNKNIKKKKVQNSDNKAKKKKNKSSNTKDKSLKVKRDSVIRPSAAKKLKKAKSVNTVTNTLKPQTNAKKSKHPKKMSKAKSYDKKKGESSTKKAKVTVNGKKPKTKMNAMKKSKSCMDSKAGSLMNGSEKRGNKKKKTGNSVISDGGKIWDLFVKQRGTKPKSIYQLESFAKSNKKAKTLSHKEARELFRDRSK